MKILIDTNIIVSDLLWNNKESLILNEIFKGKHTNTFRLAVSGYSPQLVSLIAKIFIQDIVREMKSKLCTDISKITLMQTH